MHHHPDTPAERLLEGMPIFTRRSFRVVSLPSGDFVQACGGTGCERLLFFGGTHMRAIDRFGCHVLLPEALCYAMYPIK
jgi:hypothetical protein